LSDVTKSWWLDDLNPAGLSQGDILSQRITGNADFPLKYLSRAPLNKNGKKVWQESPNFDPIKSDNKGLYISRGHLVHMIVISHSCELDKTSKVVLVAPIAQLDRIADATMRENILSQRRHALLPLPDVPNLGTYYADFRSLSYIDKKAISPTCRLASMNDEGIIRLRAQLLAFFTRINPNILGEAIDRQIKAENQ